MFSNKTEVLKKAQNNFLNFNSLTIKIGIELEFFLLQGLLAIENQDIVKNFITDLKSELLRNFSLIYEVEKEQGVSQIEIKTKFTNDLFELANQIDEIKKFIKNFAQNKDLNASFAAQPFIDDCGNALQFNISLHDENNFFAEKYLNNMIAALLEKTHEMLIFLAPNKEDHLRFCPKINQNLFKKGKFTAPINLSFGFNNRTCAIRIMPSNEDKNNKRLEYRVAAADADIFLSMAVILDAISYGLKNDLNLEKSVKI